MDLRSSRASRQQLQSTGRQAGGGSGVDFTLAHWQGLLLHRVGGHASMAEVGAGFSRSHVGRADHRVVCLRVDRCQGTTVLETGTHVYVYFTLRLLFCPVLDEPF